MKIKIFFILSILILSGCNNESKHVTTDKPSKTPTEVYMAYHKEAKSNLDFNVELSYYSQNMKEKINSKINNHVDKKNKSIDDVKSKYIKFISESTTCMELYPLSESFYNNGLSVELSFDITDLCSDHIGAIQKVVMVNEDGWKIDDIELIL